MKTEHLRDAELLEPTVPQAAHVATCEDCRRRQEVQRRVRTAVQALDRHAPPSPVALLLLKEASSAARRRTRALRAAAVACIVACVAWFVGRGRSPREPFSAPLVDELALDHIHYLHKPEAAEVRGDPAVISAWFAGRLGFAPHLGNLEAASIEGAKSCRIGGSWTALVWLERAGHWLSLFSMPEHDAKTRGCAIAQGVRVCAVRDPRGGSRVVIGDLPPDELLRLADESLQ
jgi:hypothetical protein